VIVRLLVWPFALVSLMMRKRMRVFAPLCDRHRYMWFRRNLLLIFGFGTLWAVLCLLANSPLNLGRINDLALPQFQFWVVGPSWLLAGLLLRAWAIRPTEITDETITLSGVSSRFVEAF